MSISGRISNRIQQSLQEQYLILFKNRHSSDDEPIIVPLSIRYFHTQGGPGREVNFLFYNDYHKGHILVTAEELNQIASQLEDLDKFVNIEETHFS